jgi:membrane protein involved in colicin uptake
MSGSKPYAELVTRAEEATAAIKDPELRRLAFERVLDDLLVGGVRSTQGASRSAGSAKRPARKELSAKVNRGPKGYIRELLDDGFFKKPKTIAQVKVELANRGHHIAVTSLSGPLQSLCQARALRRHKAKATDEAKKVTFNYSEW